jgi:hypothetical protein
MTPGHLPPPLDVEFRDHYSEQGYDNVVAETEFFTPAEFEAADHRIRGTFDEKGQFRGTVRVFDSEPVDVVIPYEDARGSEEPMRRAARFESTWPTSKAIETARC